MSKVKVYTTTNCPYCKMTKEFLKENKVEYEEVNIQEDSNAAREMVEKTGQMGVPVVDIEGQLIIGYDAEKLKKYLKL